jgi:PleD family two-component response regulator
VAEPIAWGEHLLMISISVGVTISEPGEDPATLLSRADDAMYAQKAGSVRQLR